MVQFFGMAFLNCSTVHFIGDMCDKMSCMFMVGRIVKMSLLNFNLFIINYIHRSWKFLSKRVRDIQKVHTAVA